MWHVQYADDEKDDENERTSMRRSDKPKHWKDREYEKAALEAVSRYQICYQWPGSFHVDARRGGKIDFAVLSRVERRSSALAAALDVDAMSLWNTLVKLDKSFSPVRAAKSLPDELWRQAAARRGSHIDSRNNDSNASNDDDDDAIRCYALFRVMSERTDLFEPLGRARFRCRSEASIKRRLLAKERADGALQRGKMFALHLLRRMHGTDMLVRSDVLRALAERHGAETLDDVDAFEKRYDELEALATAPVHDAERQNVAPALREALRLLDIECSSPAAFALLQRLGRWSNDANPVLEHWRRLRRDAEASDASHEAVRNAIDRAQARAQVDIDHDAERRWDLRNVPALVVDAGHVVDPDDALSIVLVDNTEWVVAHVCDASFLIDIDSPLDRLARRRIGTLYGDKQRIQTMLPSAVGDVLRLRGGAEVKRTLAIAMRFDDDGDLVEWRVRRASMRCTRLTLGSADKLLETGAAMAPSLKALPSSSSDGNAASAAAERAIQPSRLVWRRLSQIARLRHDRRLSSEHGATMVGIFDWLHEPSSAIVQELMIAANTAAALFARDREIPFAFRRNEADGVAVKPAPCNYLGVPCYGTATSPMRSYIDLLNHQQLSAVVGGAGADRTRLRAAAALHRVANENHVARDQLLAVDANATRWRLLRYFESQPSSRLYTARVLPIPGKSRMLPAAEADSNTFADRSPLRLHFVELNAYADTYLSHAPAAVEAYGHIAVRVTEVEPFRSLITFAMHLANADASAATLETHRFDNVRITKR
jgi:RNB domain